MFQLNHNVYFIMVHALSDMVKYPTSEKKKKMVQNSVVHIKFTSAGALFLKVKVHVN